MCTGRSRGRLTHTIYTWFLFDSSLDKTKTSEPDWHNHMGVSGRKKAEKTHVLRRRGDMRRLGCLSELRTRSIERLLGCGRVVRSRHANGARAGADLRHPTRRRDGTIGPSSHAGDAWRAIRRAQRAEEDPLGRKSILDACRGVWA